VAILSLVIGREVGLNDRALFDLGIGAMLYDIGMASVPKEIVGGGPDLELSKLETLHKHTEEGFKILQQNQMISATAQSIALQHHEKYDGTGYPRGLSGDQIHIYAKIVAVADVYDSLLSDRPNRPKFQPHEAYEYIITAGGFDFDLDIIQAFTRCIAPYPVGTMVQLNTGEQGVVSKITWGLATRPTIRLFYDKDGNSINGKIDIDLVEKPSVLVDKIIET
jgi:HD-GYP domain-containing protein (c-di-GMP phosphodiesterase class II)